MDLVYEPYTRFTSHISTNGKDVVLARLSSSSYGCAELARAFRFEGLETARCGSDDHIFLHFDAPATARAFVEGWAQSLDLGPFEVAEQNNQHIVLRRRGTTRLDQIEILAMGADEQWRRLLARDIDVIPSADSIHEHRLAGVGSVRLISLAPTSQYALWFNTRSSTLPPIVRTAIARAIKRDAIAAIACGSAACASSSWLPAPAPEIEADLPDTLSLISLDTDEGASLAGKVIKHQLRAKLDVILEQISVDQVFQRVQSGQFDMALLPATMDADRLFVSDEPRNVSGYANPAYDRAVLDGDLATAREILSQDMPAYPLYELRTFSAVDERFCGGAPERTISWRWLAEVYPCSEGEP